MDLAQLVSYLSGFAMIFGTILAGVGIVLFAVGRDARPALLWAAAMLLIGASGYALVEWFFPGGGLAPGGQGFIVTPADYYSQTGEVMKVARYFPLEVTVIPVYPVYSYTVYIDWGDGEAGSWPPGQPELYADEPATLSHTYHNTGVYNVKVNVDYCYLISFGNDVDCYSLSRQFQVNVTAPWYEYSEAIKSAISEMDEDGGRIESAVKRAFKAAGIALAGGFANVMDIMAEIMARLGMNGGYALHYYVTMPEPDGFKPLRTVYGLSSQVALFLLPIAVMANLLWRGVWEWEKGANPLLDLLRDVLVAGFGVYLFLELYDLAASLVNVVSLSIAQLGQLGALYAMVLAAGALASAVGLVAPSAGAFAAAIFISLLAVVLLGMLKWFLAAAIVAAAPLLIVAYVSPLRSYAAGAFRILGTLFVFTLVAGVMARLVSEMAITLTQVEGGTNLLFALATPLVFALATVMITGQIQSTLSAGAGIVGGVAREVAVKGRLQQIQQAGAAGGLGLAAAGAAATVAAARRPSGTVIGRAPSPAPAGQYYTMPQPAARPPAAGAGRAMQPAAPTAGIQAQTPHTGTRPVAEPAPVSPPADRPAIQEVPPPRGLEKLTRPVKDVIAEARGEVETVEPSLKRRAAVAAARAGLKAGGWARSQLRDFDRVLAQETGVTLGRAAGRAYHAGKWTAQQTIKAAKWAAPYAKEYGAKAVNAARVRANAWISRVRDAKTRWDAS
ncbi:MAG: hypothetical protein GSR84_00275 [Desulfurococcales archaeon]|nr:hypothetical protein [Desulfurococcales archaeon]